MGTQTAIDLSPILTDLIQLVGLILLGASAWAAKKIADYFHLKQDDSARQLIEQALQNGIRYAQNLAESAAKGTKVDVQNAFVGTAANYVITHVPDALTRLGITEQQLADKIVSRLPQ